MSNILATPRKWKSKAVILKTESTYGTDPTPTGAANFIEARNVSLMGFDPELVDRNIETSTLGNGGKIVAGTWAKLSFDVALVGSGTAGTAPKWAPILMACGLAETLSAGVSATYNLVSSSFSSVTAYLNIDGINYKFIGARGEAKAKIDAKGIPMLSFELTAQYTAPTDTSMPSLTKTGWMVEEAVNSVNTAKVTINSVDMAFSMLEWSLGNKISKINLPGPQFEAAIIDRAPTCSVTVLAPALSVFNPYTLAAANTAFTMTNTHGATAGYKCTTTIKGVIIGVQEDQVEGIAAYKLNIEPRPVSGNDEIALVMI